jgi:hypothetical protein
MTRIPDAIAVIAAALTALWLLHLIFTAPLATMPEYWP